MKSLYHSSFRKRAFPDASARQWNDWTWQLRHVFRSADALNDLFRLADDERSALTTSRLRLPFAVTPYYASLLSAHHPDQALRKTVIPRTAEIRRCAGEREDPLGEESHSPVPGIVHSYPDKALFLATDLCAVYCRFCTRSRTTGRGRYPPRIENWKKGLAYIRKHREIRDVLISGGEPLLLSDRKLDWLLSSLRKIKHVELIRIGTKIPAVLPQRITPGLVRVLKKYHPLWLSVHFTHPDELTPECARACAMIADAGIPMCSQTVLLKGVNDSPAIIKKLMLGLLKIRVKPYYLHQCDAVVGSSQFRTPIETGWKIIHALHGHTTGYAVPLYMLDAPGGGGKVPLSPNYITGRKKGVIQVRNYQGRKYSY
ncbi:MAG: KamA family radical SAM protein [Lentisphaerota bacterium]